MKSYYPYASDINPFMHLFSGCFFFYFSPPKGWLRSWLSHPSQKWLLCCTLFARRIPIAFCVSIVVIILLFSYFWRTFHIFYKISVQISGSVGVFITFNLFITIALRNCRIIIFSSIFSKTVILILFVWAILMGCFVKTIGIFKLTETLTLRIGRCCMLSRIVRFLETV